MTDHFDKRAQQPRLSEGCEVSPEELDAMTPAELAEAMECALDAMTEETYDPALIDAYLDALDRKTPIPEVPDAQSAFVKFQQRVLDTFPESKGPTQKSSLRPRKLWRTLLTAAVLVACLFGCMIAAQAAGVDVFGAMARWTSEVFSFGTIRQIPDGTDPYAAAGSLDDQNFSSLQEVLDTYGITEVTAPTWIPEGYELERIDIIDLDDPKMFSVFTGYANGRDILEIDITKYNNEPLTQIEKVDQAPEFFEVCGQSFYVIENTENCTVAWVTEHFECQIAGPLAQKSNLREMVYSMFD